MEDLKNDYIKLKRKQEIENKELGVEIKDQNFSSENEHEIKVYILFFC